MLSEALCELESVRINNLEEKVSTCVPPFTLCEDSLVENFNHSTPTLNELELQHESSYFFDSLTFVNYGELEAEINKFLHLKSKPELNAKQLKPDHSFYKDMCLLNEECVDVLFHDSISHMTHVYHLSITQFLRIFQIRYFITTIWLSLSLLLI